MYHVESLNRCDSNLDFVWDLDKNLLFSIKNSEESSEHP